MQALRENPRVAGIVRTAPLYLLSFAVLWWILLVGRLVIQRHNSYATFDFDLGIHDQSLWLLAHGKWFNTVCGLNVFGHHAMFMYYVLVPLVWLGRGPNTWNVLQVIALGSSAIPLFLMARRKLANEYIALGVAVAWLLVPTTTWLAWETFHPEVMAVPFLLAGIHMAQCRPEGTGRHVRNHNIATVAWLAVAMLWKEDIALAVMGLGIILMVRGRRRFGLAVAVGAAAYFAFVGLWMVPALTGEISAYGNLYGDLGRTPLEVLKNSVVHPSRFFTRLDNNNALDYGFQIVRPWSFLPLLSPLTLLMMVPQFFINILGVYNFTWAIKFHYQAVPFAISAVAAVEGLALLKRHGGKAGRYAIVAVLVSGFSWSVARGALPFSREYGPAVWGQRNSYGDGFDAARKRIGPDDVISVHYLLVPHMSQREVVYSFPNPWIRANFLSTPDRYVPLGEVKWIVMITDQIDEQSKTLIDGLVKSGEFGDAETIGGVTSYRRLSPPRPQSTP